MYVVSWSVWLTSTAGLGKERLTKWPSVVLYILQVAADPLTHPSLGRRLLVFDLWSLFCDCVCIAKNCDLSFHRIKIVACVLWLCFNRIKVVICHSIEKNCLLCFVIVLEKNKNYDMSFYRKKLSVLFCNCAWIDHVHCAFVCS